MMKAGHWSCMLQRAWVLLAIVVLPLSSFELMAAPSLHLPKAPQSLLLDIIQIDQRLIVVGERGHILLTDDAEGNWVQAQVPVTQLLTAVYFSDYGHGWAVGHDGVILTSIDRGEHWVLQRDGLVEQRAFNKDKLARLQNRSQKIEQILLSPSTLNDSLKAELEELAFDIEDTQQLLTSPPYAPPLLDIYFSDPMRGVAVGAFNTLLVTTDGGLHWVDSADLLINPDEFHLNAITGNGNGILWIAGEGGQLFKSIDYGASWSALKSPYPGSWFGIIYAQHSNTLIVFGLKGNIFFSHDGGESWQRSQSSNERSIAGGTFINANYAVLVGSVGTLLVSKDGGKSFTPRLHDKQINLSSVICHRGKAVVVGQDGIHLLPCLGDGNE